MPKQLFDSETGRANARKRHDAATPEQRAEALRPAREAKATVDKLDAKVDLLGAAMLDQFAQLRAEIARLTGDRIAA